jgi:uncharacterized protein (DUF934 family)
MADVEKNPLDALKEKHRRLAVIEIDGVTLAFRPFSKAAVIDVRKNLDKRPDAAIDILINSLKFVCVYGVEHFDQVAQDRPMALAGRDGLHDALMQMAKGNPKIQMIE